MLGAMANDTPSGTLSLFESLRDRDYAREGLLVCEGRIVMEKALQAGLAIRSLLTVPADEEQWRLRAPAGTPVYALPAAAMEAHIGFKFHHGALALAERPYSAERPSQVKPAERPYSAERPRQGGQAVGLDGIGPALALWNVTDPDNLGALIRSAAALGAVAIYLGGGCADPYGRKALRASMGNALCLPLFILGSEAELEAARGPGGNALVAAALSPGAKAPGELRRGRLPTLVLGNEGWGLPQPVLERCDEAVMLPMARGVDSLNVGAAGAILMWELFPRAG
jgi:tRNA G18 (ribose-2'-O)-methylase SpoU